MVLDGHGVQPGQSLLQQPLELEGLVQDHTKSATAKTKVPAYPDYTPTKLQFGVRNGDAEHGTKGQDKAGKASYDILVLDQKEVIHVAQECVAQPNPKVQSSKEETAKALKPKCGKVGAKGTDLVKQVPGAKAIGRWQCHAHTLSSASFRDFFFRRAGFT